MWSLFGPTITLLVIRELHYTHAHQTHQGQLAYKEIKKAKQENENSKTRKASHIFQIYALHFKYNSFFKERFSCATHFPYRTSSVLFKSWLSMTLLFIITNIYKKSFTTRPIYWLLWELGRAAFLWHDSSAGWWQMCVV